MSHRNHATATGLAVLATTGVDVALAPSPTVTPEGGPPVVAADRGTRGTP